jgi:hypothetical protein
LDTLTSVAIFGQYVVVSGTVAAPLVAPSPEDPDPPSYFDVFQAATIETVEAETGVETKLSRLSAATTFGGVFCPTPSKRSIWQCGALLMPALAVERGRQKSFLLPIQ